MVWVFRSIDPLSESVFRKSESTGLDSSLSITDLNPMIWNRFSGSAELGIRLPRSPYMDPMTKHLTQFLNGNCESVYRMKRGLGIYQNFSLSVSNNRFNQHK